MLTHYQATGSGRRSNDWFGHLLWVFAVRQPNWHELYLPADGLDDAVQLVIGGWVAAAQREHKVDRIKQAREGLGKVGCLVRLQRVLQSLLWAAYTQKMDTKIKKDAECTYTEDVFRRQIQFSSLSHNSQSEQELSPLHCQVAFKTFQINQGTHNILTFSYWHIVISSNWLIYLCWHLLMEYFMLTLMETKCHCLSSYYYSVQTYYQRLVCVFTTIMSWLCHCERDKKGKMFKVSNVLLLSIMV